MTINGSKSLLGAALVVGVMTLGAGAQAYWDDPRGGPWSERGPGGGPWSEPAPPYSRYGPAPDRTRERQIQMRDHSTAMQSLVRMLSGRRAFNRAEAIGLARQIEASAGENLTQMFKPGGNWRRSPLSRARVGDDMDVFKHHAIAMMWAAGELADQLEKQPSAEDIRTGRAWSPDWGRGDTWRSRGRSDRAALTGEVFTAYNNLKATCSNCHANFRTERR